MQAKIRSVQTKEPEAMVTNADRLGAREGSPLCGERGRSASPERSALRGAGLGQPGAHGTALLAWGAASPSCAPTLPWSPDSSPQRVSHVSVRTGTLKSSRSEDTRPLRIGTQSWASSSFWKVRAVRRSCPARVHLAGQRHAGLGSHRLRGPAGLGAHGALEEMREVGAPAGAAAERP